MFIKHFADLKDPRIERKKLHALMDILVLTVCAVASGAEGWLTSVGFFTHNLGRRNRPVLALFQLPSLWIL